MKFVEFIRPKSLINQSLLKRFIKTYAGSDNWHEIDSATGNLGYGWVHYALIRTMRPSRVLCIGSKYGFIPAICALACKENKKGIVDFVDANYNFKDPRDSHHHWGGVGFWNPLRIKKHFQQFGLEKVVQAHIMTSAQFSHKYPKKTWSYVYVDGDHSYQGIQKDFEFFWPRLEHKGFLTIHDIYTRELGDLDYGVFRYWPKIKLRYGGFEIPGQCGLGIIQKS